MVTRLVGILNLTPDSFSDGGKYTDCAQALAAVAGMRQDGISIIDLGAESTRPGAEAIGWQEEWARLRPALEALVKEYAGTDLRFSIDTYHPETAARALDLGAHWINDVSGFSNPAMVEAVRAHDGPLVVMHSLSVPADPAVTLPPGCDPVREVASFMMERADALSRQGIAPQRLVFDPGIGFSKTGAQSLALLSRVKELKAAGFPLLIGHSRKSYLKPFAGDAPGLRDALTLALSARLTAAGVDYLRVHDTRAHAAMLRMTDALDGNHG